MPNRTTVPLQWTGVHRARVAVQNDPKSRSRYDALRGRGRSSGRALRGVADRLPLRSLDHG